MKLLSILSEISKVIYSDMSDQDKIIEIANLLPKPETTPTETAEIFGQQSTVKRIGSAVIFDGSEGIEYTETPRLANPDDIFYIGCGCTWDTDLDGKRYWKLYDPSKDKFRIHTNLSTGDIINEKARIEKIVKETVIKYFL